MGYCPGVSQPSPDVARNLKFVPSALSEPEIPVKPAISHEKPTCLLEGVSLGGGLTPTETSVNRAQSPTRCGAERLKSHRLQNLVRADSLAGYNIPTEHFSYKMGVEGETLSLLPTCL